MGQQWWDEVEVERRFLLDRDQTERFLAVTTSALTLADHHRQAPVAYTRTTYLDTADGAYLRRCNQHDAGLAEVARRVRIREYAAGVAPETPAYLTGVSFLELKESMGVMRKKRRVAAPPGILAELVAGRSADFAISPGDRGALAAIERRRGGAALQPCLVTWYRRWSFRARSAPIRVTLDEGLAYCEPPTLAEVAATGSRSLASEQAAPTDVVSYGPRRVLEIKLRGQTPDWLEAAMANLPAPSQFSKFQTGMSVLMDSGPPARTSATRPISIPRCMAPLPH